MALGAEVTAHIFCVAVCSRGVSDEGKDVRRYIEPKHKRPGGGKKSDTWKYVLLAGAGSVAAGGGLLVVSTLYLHNYEAGNVSEH